ncbi:MAG: hypothetical protein HY270_07665 [Deltaproteobacteria bacterium]|nr:hypothetical protein [Deltaproteobacteria bacterium]
MNKTSLAALALVAIFVAIALLRHSSHEPAFDSEPTAADNDASGASGNQTAARVLIDRSAAAHGSAAGSSGSAAAANNDRSSAADSLQKRLAAAGAQGLGHGSESTSGSRVDADDGNSAHGVADEERPALRPPRGANPANAGGPDAAAADSAAEPVADFNFDSGVDKSYALDKRTEITDADKLGGPMGTVSFWVKPQWEAGNQDNATFLQIGDGGLRFMKVGDTLRFEYPDKNGVQQGIGIGIGTLQSGQWHLVTGTWTDSTNTLLVDGRPTLVNADAQPPDFQSGTNVFVGNGGASAPGEVAGVKISNFPSSAGAIAQQFQSGPHPR